MPQKEALSGSILTELPHLEDMDGVALYTGLRARKPALAARLILVTNDAPRGAMQRFLDDSGVHYIQKPFAPAEIRRIAAERTGVVKAAVAV